MITVGYRNLPEGGRAWAVKRSGHAPWDLTDDEMQELSAVSLLMLAEARNEDAEVDATHQTSAEAALEASEW